MDSTKLLSQCAEAIRLNFRELVALYLLPDNTARALTKQLSAETFKALELIYATKEAVLHYNLKVITKYELRELDRRYGKVFAIMFQTSLESKRLTFHGYFKYVYRFFHLALSHLLPFTYSTKCATSAGPSKAYILQYSRVWLLAVALLPKETALNHVKKYAEDVELIAFREIAHNLLAGWFQLSNLLKIKYIDKQKNELELLADRQKELEREQLEELIAKAYLPLQFACDHVTYYGCRELFPGFVPWPTKPKMTTTASQTDA